VRDAAVVERDEDSIGLVPTLAANTANADELDRIVAEIAKAPFIEHASWAIRARE
jgi:putative Mg2+ transporter-C (MgtC) family protein